MIALAVKVLSGETIGDTVDLGVDGYTAMAKMAADPVTQDWWAKTRPCFTKYSPDKQEPFYSDM